MSNKMIVNVMLCLLVEGILWIAGFGGLSDQFQ
jgi:hypothetical protein